MRIGLDIGRALRGHDGVASYSSQLAGGLLATDHDSEYRLFDLDASRCEVDAVERMFGHLPANACVCPTSRAGLEDLDIFHSTAFRLPPPGARRLVFTVHDLTFISHPHLHTVANRVRSLASTARALAHGAAVIAVSEATRRALAVELALPPSVVAVIPPVLDPRFSPVEQSAQTSAAVKRFGIRQPYLLHVGSLEPRKNLAGVIEAFELLPADLKRDLQLVVVSSQAWGDLQTKELLDELVRDDRAVFLADLGVEDLAAVYSAGEALVYPSFVEGFGLPVAEAMACGTAVVTSNRSSLEEVAGEAAVLVDPESPGSIAAGLESLLVDADLRRELVALGLERSSEYSRERVIPLVLDLYRRLAED
jgi:glycosyltransferase involved in cell wall biosynthesis